MTTAMNNWSYSPVTRQTPWEKFQEECQRRDIKLKEWETAGWPWPLMAVSAHGWWMFRRACYLKHATLVTQIASTWCVPMEVVLRAYRQARARAGAHFEGSFAEWMADRWPDLKAGVDLTDEYFAAIDEMFLPVKC